MFQVLLLITIFQVLFFSVLIITKKEKTLSDNILFAWLLFLAIHVLLIYLSMEYGSKLYNYLGFSFSIPHGVFLFQYVRNLTNTSSKLSFKDLIHLIPFITCVLFVLLTNDVAKCIIGVRIVSFLSAFTYIILSLRSIKQYQFSIKGHYSNIDKINLDWLKHLIYGIIGFCICGVLLGLIPNLHNIELPFNEIFSLFILLFISILGYKGIRQNSIISGAPISIQKESESKEISSDICDTNTNISYVNNGLKDIEAQKLALEIKQYMEREKPYLNMELNLDELAVALNTYPHYLTQVFNTILKQNFYEFINSYRIEEVKKELINPKNANLTILAIAYNCGFNSKSSFNRIFKQRTGKTPSEYKKSIS